ncbi:MAG TPA: hypothetical protein VGE74_03380 [Gemmata sp.]
MSDATPAPPEQWAIVELMGHARFAGRLSEVEMVGAKLGRLDIPTPDGGFATKLFGGGSVYAVSFVDEAAARAVAARSQVPPVHAWELPKALPPAAPVATAPAGRRQPGEYDEPPLRDEGDGDDFFPGL